MTEPTGRRAARAAARLKLAGLLPGQTGLNLADEVADAVLAAAQPEVRAATITEAADLLTRRGYHLPSDFIRCMAAAPAPH